MPVTATRERSDNGAKKAPPVAEARIGRVKACIWENNAQNGTQYNVTFSRLYKDGEHWKESTSFGRDDLLVLAKVADQAHTWIADQQQSPAAF